VDAIKFFVGFTRGYEAQIEVRSEGMSFGDEGVEGARDLARVARNAVALQREEIPVDRPLPSRRAASGRELIEFAVIFRGREGRDESGALRAFHGLTRMGASGAPVKYGPERPPARTSFG
jgi:hypothetical protein